MVLDIWCSIDEEFLLVLRILVMFLFMLKLLLVFYCGNLGDIFFFLFIEFIDFLGVCCLVCDGGGGGVVCGCM